MILGTDGKTAGTCANCRFYALTQATMCQWEPTFVARLPTDTCGQWTPNDATATIIQQNLFPSPANSAIVSGGNPAA